MFEIFRWVRDHLLEFQDMVSSYNTFLRTKMQQLQKSVSGAGSKSTQAIIEEIESHPANEEEIDLFVFHTMTNIRREYLTHRCKGEEEALATAIPTFDEYVR